MYKFSQQLHLWIACIVCASSLCAKATKPSGEVKMAIPPGNYQHQLGKNKIEDPSGRSHTKADVAGKVLVAVFTAPNMSQGDRQRRWVDLLATDPATKVNDHVALVMVEDMSQAGMFKGVARDDIKKEFTPDSRPFVVIDETGDFLKRFGVARGRTEILIYDKTGKLRDVETDLDDQDATLHRIKVITRQLMAE